MEGKGEVPEYTIRTMRKEEIPQALDLWRETGLSEGVHSVDTWYEYDPEGFYVAATDEGEVLGVCAGVLQHSELAFIGMYAVKSAYQRRGIGIKIWKAVMDRIGGRNAGVNPVPNQLTNYRDRAGFNIQTSWCSAVCVSTDIFTHNLVSEIPGINVKRLYVDDSLMHDVTRYDTEIHGFSRSKIMPLVVQEEESVTMIAVRDEGEQTCGYGNIRKCITGYAIVGPLYADNLETAELLLTHLIDAFPLSRSHGLRMMITDANPDALTLVDKVGLIRKVGISRLYNKEEVNANFNRVFCQHNLNFSVF